MKKIFKISKSVNLKLYTKNENSFFKNSKSFIDSKLNGLFDKGFEYFENSNYLEAFKMFDEIINHDINKLSKGRQDKCVSIFVFLAKTAFYNDKFGGEEKAKNYLVKALEINQNSQEVIELVHCLFSGKDNSFSH